MIVTDKRVLEFADAQIGPFNDDCTCIGLDVGGEIVTATVFNSVDAHSLNMSVAGSVWTRELLHAIGSYAFDQLGSLRITCITEQPAVAEMGLRSGGEIEGLLRNHFGKGRDGIIIGFLKEDWPW